MNIYLIRHAEAVPRETPEFEDDDRPLTEAGHEQAARLGSALRNMGVAFDAVVTSPLPRAVQTAEGMLAQSAEPKPELLLHDELAGKMRPRRVCKYLQKLEAETVAVVGHEPLLGRFAGWLIGSKKAQLELEKGGFALIECDTLDKAGGTLKWLITPQWCAEGVAAGAPF